MESVIKIRVYGESSIDFAAIPYSAKTLRWLLKAREVWQAAVETAYPQDVKSAPTAGFEVTWFDATPEFYTEDVCSEYVANEPAGTDGNVEIVTGAEAEANRKAAECAAICVGSYGVRWTAYPRGSDHTVETSEIDWETVERLLDRFPAQ